jgi:crotonobetainyl-CoA:carnitine CoA-transferase CaiB-like acyl-CoA transferase
VTSAACLFFLEAIREGLAGIHAPGPIPACPALEVAGEGGLASTFPVTDLAVASIGSAALALASYIGATGSRAPGVRVDRRLASLWFGRSILPQGWRMPDVRDPLTGDYRGADGWIRLHMNAPHHRRRALAALGTGADPADVAAAVSRRSVWPLEEDLVAAGACAAAMRTREQWSAHPQGRAVAVAPLFAHADAGSGGNSTAGSPDAARPLAGLRVLDLTRVLAGPVSTRFLAGYGARVLRVDPPAWTEPGMIPEVTLGKHCTGLDLTEPAHRARFIELLSQADVLVHGYRPDALARMGFDDDARQRIRPGLVDVSLDAYGWSGPWSARRGFDSLVQMSCGIADAGMRGSGADRPVPLPVQALDQASGYLMAAAVLHGLIRRFRQGRGGTVKLALACTARLLMSAPTHVEQGMAPSGERDFGVWEEMTDWGPARRLKPPCEVAGAPMHWMRPAGRLRVTPARDFSWKAQE